MIYLTDNKEIKKYYYTNIVLECNVPRDVYTDIRNEKHLQKLKELGFKFHKLQFGDKITERYFFNGQYFLKLNKREIDWKSYWGQR